MFDPRWGDFRPILVKILLIRFLLIRKGVVNADDVVSVFGDLIGQTIIHQPVLKYLAHACR